MAIVPVPVLWDPVIVSLLCIIVFLIYCHFHRIYSLFDTLKIPGPKPKWIFGSIHEFRDKNPFDVFKEWRKRYGDVYGYFEGFRPSIVINDPELAKQVLVRHFDKFHVRPIYTPFSYPPDEYSLLHTFGETWKRQRMVVASAFNTASAQHLLTRMQETGRTLLCKLEEKSKENPQGFDISKLLDRYTLDAFAFSGFEYDVGSMEDENAVLYQYMKAYNDSAAADNPLAGLARVYESLTPFLKIFDRKHKHIHKQHLQKVRDVLQDQRKRLEKSANDPSSKNLLSQMILSAIPFIDEDGIPKKRHISDMEIVAHVNSLIGGGLGTTNAALSFVIHQLAMNQDVQQKAYETIVEHFGSEGNIELSALKDEVFLDMLINETLRMLPVAPGVARMCTEDCEINGVSFRKGMMIRIMNCTLYADEKMYPEPEKFNPERFSASQKQKRHPYAFLPYGQGPRICPGIKLASLLLKVSIIGILQKYVIEPCSQTADPLPTALRPMLVPKDGVFVQLRERN